MFVLSEKISAFEYSQTTGRFAVLTRKDMSRVSVNCENAIMVRRGNKFLFQNFFLVVSVIIKMYSGSNFNQK